MNERQVPNKLCIWTLITSIEAGYFSDYQKSAFLTFLLTCDNEHELGMTVQLQKIGTLWKKKKCFLIFLDNFVLLSYFFHDFNYFFHYCVNWNWRLSESVYNIDNML